MAYSTQNMYQMFDIIPNFVRRMFPFSLKTYPSCTNPMAWDRRDEIRSAYILSMVHQRDNKNAIIDGNAYENQNLSSKPVADTGHRTSELSRKRAVLMNSSHLFTPMSSHSEELLYITNIENKESTPKSAGEKSPKTCEDENIRFPSPPKSIYQRKRIENDDYDLASSTIDNRSSGQTIQLAMDSTSKIFRRTDAMENQPFNVAQNSKHSVAKSDAKPTTVRREYQLLAQKFHQYTINCRTTIRTLEKKLKKLIDDKHALLHGMVSMRKGQKDVIKKYRKIFNDAMNEHCNEINALLANYKVIRDNYLELLQHETSVTDPKRNEEVISVSYTSYNCC